MEANSDQLATEPKIQKTLQQKLQNGFALAQQQQIRTTLK